MWCYMGSICSVDLPNGFSGYSTSMVVVGVNVMGWSGGCSTCEVGLLLFGLVLPFLLMLNCW